MCLFITDSGAIREARATFKDKINKIGAVNGMAPDKNNKENE